MSHTKLFVLTLIATFWGFGLPALAQDSGVPTNGTPVAVISDITNPGTQLKRHNGDQLQSAYWLDLLYPGDVIQTGDASEVTVTYLHNRRKYTLGSGAEAVVRVDKPSTDGLFSQKLKRTDKLGPRSGQPFQAAALLTEPTPTARLAEADSNNLAGEKIQLAGYVDVGIYPPVFRWAPNSLSDYQLSIFDERGQFLHSFDLEDEVFDYPHHSQAPLRLTKGASYYWQVKDVDGNEIVNKSPFSPLTRIQIKELNRYSYLLNEADKTTYVDLLLAQLQQGALDKYLHLLERMDKIDPHNPRLKRLLANSYLKRGAPNHAKKQLEEIQALSATTPVTTLPPRSLNENS